jgi:tRNA-2-methylthio-N6-dimethylallyladenosine synthase
MADAMSEFSTTEITAGDEDLHSTAVPGNSRKVFIKTYGCQMNVYDSERMEDALSGEGFVQTNSMEEADLVLLNTCHIREKAAEKVFSEIGRIRQLKERRAGTGKPLTLGVTGCVAQAEGEEIMRRAPAVDLVAGPQTYHRLNDMVSKAASGERVIATEFEIEQKFAQMPQIERRSAIARGVAAFLTVQEGCDKFCTFCVVPYTRGAEVSRSPTQIIEEAKRLRDAGVREITLLGQNVNAWAGTLEGRSLNLGELIFELAEIDGVERLRYTTSHPIDMHPELLTAHRDVKKLMPYLHLPVQAGSDRVLKAMNRHHTRAEYIDLIATIREARPDMAISGDFIVGFPGETDADFEDTMQVIREVTYASAFSFKYSPRPGTPGAELDAQVPETVKSERLQVLQDLLKEQQIAFNKACVGKQMDILLEKRGRKDGQLIGRSPWLQSVVVDGEPEEIGHFIRVRVTHGGPASLLAERA